MNNSAKKLGNRVKNQTVSGLIKKRSSYCRFWLVFGQKLTTTQLNQKFVPFWSVPIWFVISSDQIMNNSAKKLGNRVKNQTVSGLIKKRSSYCRFWLVFGQKLSTTQLNRKFVPFWSVPVWFVI